MTEPTAATELAAWRECGAVGHLVEDLMKEGGYGAILDDPAKHADWQDVLDSVLQARLFAVRNALRDQGYIGEPYKALVTQVNGTALALRNLHARVGAGQNIVSTTFELYDPSTMNVLNSVVDRVDRTAEDFARHLHAGAVKALGVEQIEPAEAVAQIHALLQQAQSIWAGIDRTVREELADANVPGTPLAELMEQGVAAAQEMVDHIAAQSPRPH
ncbi:hypothetical protein [Pseudoxanthomonas kaohsiungensis]|uniref:Uncharacterized protein n=1 Tax=Pseudoxanthomonas kaohsiungensis TaxID=283923 RepID=A0ABW3M0R0_9GAMM|nr:hypothetical protein [Pseudoxanthomonas kaohsiungensis]